MKKMKKIITILIILLSVNLGFCQETTVNSDGETVSVKINDKGKTSGRGFKRALEKHLNKGVNKNGGWAAKKRKPKDVLSVDKINDEDLKQLELGKLPNYRKNILNSFTKGNGKDIGKTTLMEENDERCFRLTNNEGKTSLLNYTTRLDSASIYIVSWRMKAVDSVFNMVTLKIEPKPIKGKRLRASFSGNDINQINFIKDENIKGGRINKNKPNVFKVLQKRVSSKWGKCQATFLSKDYQKVTLVFKKAGGHDGRKGVLMKSFKLVKVSSF